MAFETTVTPKRTKRGIELDVRGVPKTGKDLKEIIILSVGHHASVKPLEELPNWLLVSHKQFVSLLDFTTEMYETKDRLFQTPLNVMEVDVDEDLDPVSPSLLLLAGQDPLEEFDFTS